MTEAADYDEIGDVLYVSLIEPVPADRIRYRSVENAHIVFRYQDEKLVGITIEALKYQAEKAL